MSDYRRRRDVPGDDQPRNQRQSNMDQTPSSSDLESNVLARLGLRASGGDEWQKQVRKIEQIAEEGKPGAVELISQYLHESHEAVRVAAIRALQHLEKRSPGYVPVRPLTDALSDEQWHVRAVAVEALTNYGAWRLRDEVLLDLMNRLESGSKGENELVRMLIVHLLASLVRRASLPPPQDTQKETLYNSGATLYRAALQSLMTALKDDDWQVREAAVVALGSLMDKLWRDQREQLDAMLYDDDAFVREAARLVLSKQMPPREQSLEEHLRDDLLSPTSTRRSEAALVLGEMGQLNQDTLDALLSVALDSRAQSEVRESALLALAELRSSIDEKALNRLLNDQDESVREAAQILRDVLASKQYPPDRVKPDSTRPVSDNVSHFEQFKQKRKGAPGDGGQHGS